MGNKKWWMFILDELKFLGDGIWEIIFFILNWNFIFISLDDGSFVISNGICMNNCYYFFVNRYGDSGEYWFVFVVISGLV